MVLSREGFAINKKTLILKLLWHAWRVFTETFPDSENNERFLCYIQQAQMIVFQEKEKALNTWSAKATNFQKRFVKLWCFSRSALLFLFTVVECSSGELQNPLPHPTIIFKNFQSKEEFQRIPGIPHENPDTPKSRSRTPVLPRWLQPFAGR